MSLFVPSDAGAIEQGLEREFSPDTGWVTVRRFRGPQLDIELKEQELQLEGYTTRLQGGKVWELEGRIAQDIRPGGGGQGEAPVDTWELFANVVEKDLLLLNDNPVRYLDGQDLILLREILEGKKDLDDYRTASPPFVATSSGDPLGLFGAILAGQKSVVLYQPVIRHTRTVSRYYEIPSSIANAGHVFSTTALISAYGVPSAIANNIPPSWTITRNVHASASVTTLAGWLKVYPNIQMAGGGRTQIVSEYQWGEWNTLLYTTHT